MRKEGKVYLIPHITIVGSKDYIYMQRALSLITEKDENMTFVPSTCNAIETKRIISRMAFFAGARTHSTVAALSSGVLALSFGCSMKAQGINMDVFGHIDCCLEPNTWM